MRSVVSGQCKHCKAKFTYPDEENCPETETNEHSWVWALSKSEAKRLKIQLPTPEETNKT